MVVANLLAPLIDLEEAILEGLHRLGLGWGLAIVGLTLLVRIALIPLVLRQLRAQHELAEHLPELRRLQERHRDDRERMQRELAAYYREHRVNPLNALAPVLAQIPVVISLYHVMRTDVKRRVFGHAGFLFIPHIGARPHGAVLAALVVAYLVPQLASSLIATRSLAGRRRGLLMGLPLMFVAVVPRVPAGLAVYWVTTGLWSLGQQVAIARAARAAAAGASRDRPPA